MANNKDFDRSACQRSTGGWPPKKAYCREEKGDPPRPSPQLASRGTRTAVSTCVAATTKELEKYPNAELVDVTDNTDHVCAAIVNGKLRIDATENQETVVPIAVPVETIRDGVNRAGRSQHWNLIARGSGLGTSGYPGFHFLHLKI